MLLLWDIDGTLLVGAAEAHRAALLAGIRDVFGLDVSPEVDTAGRTDRWILRALLAGAGIDGARVDDGMEAMLVASVAAYETRCPPDLRARVNPGIPDALRTLRDAGHTHGLLTGNLEAIAHRKLGAAGLGDWFAEAPGGFGSDAEDRSRLPAIARAAAAGGPDRRGTAWSREHTLVIGDTPHDIACARADGVRCLAITTGPFPADALAAADLVVASAAELPAAVQRLSCRESEVRSSSAAGDDQ